MAKSWAGEFRKDIVTLDNDPSRLSDVRLQQLIGTAEALRIGKIDGGDVGMSVEELGSVLEHTVVVARSRGMDVNIDPLTGAVGFVEEDRAQHGRLPIEARD